MGQREEYDDLPGVVPSTDGDRPSAIKRASTASLLTDILWESGRSKGGNDGNKTYETILRAIRQRQYDPHQPITA